MSRLKTLNKHLDRRANAKFLELLTIQKLAQIALFQRTYLIVILLPLTFLRILKLSDLSRLNPIVSLSSHMIILVYSGEMQELQRNVRSQLCNSICAHVTIQTTCMQKSCSIEMNAFSSVCTKSVSLKRL